MSHASNGSRRSGGEPMWERARRASNVSAGMRRVTEPSDVLAGFIELGSSHAPLGGMRRVTEPSDVLAGFIQLGSSHAPLGDRMRRVTEPSDVLAGFVQLGSLRTRRSGNACAA